MRADSSASGMKKKETQTRGVLNRLQVCWEKIATTAVPSEPGVYAYEVYGEPTAVVQASQGQKRSEHTRYFWGKHHISGAHVQFKLDWSPTPHPHPASRAPTGNRDGATIRSRLHRAATGEKRRRINT